MQIIRHLVGPEGRIERNRGGGSKESNSNRFHERAAHLATQRLNFKRHHNSQLRIHFDCPLDNLFLNFVGITADEFRSQVATGASDDEMAAWITEKSKQEEPRDIIQWNNDLRYKRISEMPIELQEFLEGYMPEFIPAGKIVYYWFDVYDIEEGRI